MTIALGILTPQSVVIAADSQEGYGDTGYTTEKQKISFGFHLKAGADDEGGAIAVTGAGDSGYLDYLHQEIIAAYRDHPTETINQFDSRLRALVGTFYREHVIPFSPHPLEQPFLELVIGAQREDKQRLWVTDRDAVRACHYAAVGSGGRYALRVLRSLTDWRATGCVKKLAAFAAFTAKEQDQYCGKETAVVCIAGNFFDFTSEEVIEKWERSFKKYRKTEGDVLRYILGFEQQEPKQNPLKQIDSSLESLRKILAAD
jgi:20S proteasome alpha/beta subunit